MRPPASAHDGGTDRQTTPLPESESQAGGDPSTDRGLLKGAAATLLGIAGIGALSGTASAAQNGTPLLVFGDGWEKHQYEIAVSGGSIQKTTHAGANDTLSWNDERVRGELWAWNVDSYLITGDLAAVTLDGSLSVHMPQGGFTSATTIHVDGRDSGTHPYDIDTHSGDIDLVPGQTGGAETDEGGSWSERNWTNDRISGMVSDRNRDSHTFGQGDPLQHLAVSDGHVRFSV